MEKLLNQSVPYIKLNISGYHKSALKFFYCICQLILCIEFDIKKTHGKSLVNFQLFIAKLQ